MIALQRAAASVLALVALSAAGADTVTRTMPFSQLGARSPLTLRTDGASATLDFGARSDEVVTGAVFRFRYVASPALDPAVSHIRLTLNGDTIGALPVANAAGRLAEQAVEVDPRLLIGFNKLVLALVATKGKGEADAARPGLWAEVSVASELELVLRPLVLADDLAILPEPFFDKHDGRRLTIPFVFAQSPAPATLRAAAVIASWFGTLARWRGTRFPVAFDTPPPGHAVAFAANDARPAFLAALAPATGPALRLMTHPDGRSKVLVILGRDAADLKVAADALVLGGTAMSGATVQVKRVQDKGPLPPYEAPAWVPPDRPVKLGDLLDWPQQLEASGRAPDLDPVRVELRAPPDLATWRGPGIPMTLKVQYTPPACILDGSLDVAINDEMLRTLPLRIASEPVIETKELFIPFYRLRSRSELKFGFRFTLRDDGPCRDQPAPVVKASVLPESSLDFSGFPHYVRMPNLAHFATIGFPFTRRADLADTVVVLPAKPAAPDIEAMLALIARLGEATGQAATRMRVAAANDAAALENADLLVIGAPGSQPLIDKWRDQMPITFAGPLRRVSRSAARPEGVFDWLGMGAPPDTAVASQVDFEGMGPAAALYAFESPVTSGRSVVVVTALVSDQLERVIDALEDRDLRRAVKGSAAFLVGGRIQSVLVGPTYHLGHLPLFAGAGYWLSQRPELVGAALTILLVTMGYVAYVLRNRYVAWRARRRK